MMTLTHGEALALERQWQSSGHADRERAARQADRILELARYRRIARERRQRRWILGWQVLAGIVCWIVGSAVAFIAIVGWLR